LRVGEASNGVVALKILLRIGVLCLPASVLVLPLIFLKGDPIFLLFTNAIGPLLLISLYMVTIYDKIIFAIQERFTSWND
jgi:hypothetical protein